MDRLKAIGNQLRMSTLLEIEAAAEALPPEQKAELFRFLADQVHRVERAAQGDLEYHRVSL